MALTLNGTTGLSGIAGSAGTPALQGNNDANTGYFFAADTLGLSTAGNERLSITSAGNVDVKTGNLTLEEGRLFVKRSTIASVDVRNSTNTSYSRIILQQGSAEGGYFQISREGTNSTAGAGANSVELNQSSNHPLVIKTNNLERLRIKGTGEVGIGDTSPDRTLHVNSGNSNECALFESTDTEVTLEFKDTTGTASLKCRNDFRLNNSTGELVRIDSDGRLLIGHTGTTDVGGIEAALQVTGTTSDNSSLTLSRFSVDDWCSFLTFSKSRNGTIGNQTACTSNERLGQIFWVGSDGTDTANGCAQIVAKADGNFSSNNCPTKLEFGVNAGGTSSTTYLTIKPSGHVEINDGNVVLANGHGVDFSASEGGTGTSNEASLLADYEEGTWTPGTTEGTAGHADNKYIKIGKIVHFFGRVHNPDDISSANVFTVTGLPFAVVASGAAGSCFGKEVNATSATTTYVTTNEYIRFYGHNAGNAWTYVRYNDLATSLCEIYYSGTYHTT